MTARGNQESEASRPDGRPPSGLSPGLGAEWLSVTLYSIGDAVIAVDDRSVVTFMNPVAEALTGWSAAEALEQPLDAVFDVVNEHSRKRVESPVARALEEGVVVGLANHTLLIARDGAERIIDDSAAPIRSADGDTVGVVLVFRDVSARRRAERHRNIRLAVNEVLAQESDIDSTGGKVVASICEALDWQAGCFWRVDERDEVLRCRRFWQKPGSALDDFRAATMDYALPRGDSLPGRAWDARSSVWVDDIVKDERFLRAAQAEKAGLRGAFAAPIRVGSHVVGVIECFARRIQQPDEDLLEMMDTISAQMGQFIERREAEAKLRRSEQELADFFENANVGLHWVGPDGTIVRVNQAELDMLGYERDEYVGHHIAEFHADRPVIDDILERLLAGEHLNREPARMRAKDGTIRDVLINSSGLFEGDEFVHTRCFTVDVTEQKRAEETRARLAAIVEASDDAIVSKSLDGTIMSWNRGAERIFGYTAEEAVGQPITLIIPPELHDEEQSILARLGRGEHIDHFETVRVAKDGRRLDISLTISPIRDADGRIIGASKVARDVTERRRAAESLREYSAGVAFLAEASKQLASLIDYRSTLRRVAELAVPEFADWCAVDMVGADGRLERVAVAHVDPARVRLVEELMDRYPPDPQAETGIGKVVRTGESEMAEQIGDAQLERVAQNDEHLRALRGLDLTSYMCVPMNAKGRTIGALIFASAGSGRHYDAGDLAMAEDLGHRCAIAVENARLYQEVRDADRRKDEFLAMLAHELRNPLAPIANGLSVLAMGEGDADETLAVMQEQVQHLVRLVDDLLDVSRIIWGQIELRTEPVELSALVRRAVEVVRALVDDDEREFVIELPEETVWLDADPVRLVQVVENLLTNAFKYTDTGDRIELTAEELDGEAVIRVRDTGLGIEPELLPRIFDLFTQSSRSLDRAQGGLGLGLTLVHRLTELHDGQVSAHSAGPGQGSTFVLRLPVGPAPEVEETASPSVPVEGRRVLVVDDNVGAAEMLSVLLGHLGKHEVEMAHDGPSALDKVKDFEPELVLLDIGLPGMDGYEVARNIRSLKGENAITLVALTGYGRDEDRRKAIDAGFDHHLVKPAELSDLEELLREAL